MSEFREDLLISPINKKRIIGIFLVCILLISLFAFSVLIYSFIFGSQRPYPSDQLSEAEWEDANPVLPPFPYNQSDFQDFFDNLNLTQDELQELIDMLEEMFDGDIDDLDLGNFSQGLLALLGSEVEVFRVYDYDLFDDMTDKLWKYECFDEYTGDGWHSTAATQFSDFYLYSEYEAKHMGKDIFRIKMPLSPSIGLNSFTIPTLFPTPLIIEDDIFYFYNIYSDPDTINHGTEALYIDDLNSTILDLDFYSDQDVNLSYYLFGLDIPDNNFINSTAGEIIDTPATIQSRYLQLPPTIDIYLANNPHVANHISFLNSTIIDESDNAFMVANKIRNYLQTYFTFPLDPNDYNPAPDGRDTVDWFCETQQGVWTDFASAFCVFARIFGIASRFVDGFNSFGIEEFWDFYEGRNAFAVKYRNIYNWAEIFIPDIYGGGQWVQMDIIFDSFGVGGNPIIGGNYDISVTADRFLYNRPDTAILTAYLSSTTDLIDNQQITFRDITSGEILGQTFTDLSGQASYVMDLDTDTTVGPHVIEARFDFFVANYTFFNIPGEIGVELTLVNPTVVNRSDDILPDGTNVQGYLYDPLNSKRIGNAEVNFTLLYPGTSIKIPNAFIQESQYTDAFGSFDEFLIIDSNVASGQYEIRVDFNGTWLLPILNFRFTDPSITNSSQRIGFNITRALSLLFYIDSFPAQDPDNPVVMRTVDTLSLTARVVLENLGPVQGKRVDFYDYTRGYVFIGSDVSDVNGLATVTYDVLDYCRAGPNLLVAQHKMIQNYSYFILDEIPSINIVSGPVPRIINRTGAGAKNTIFNIEGDILDVFGNPISDSMLRLRLLRGVSDYTSYLNSSGYFWTDYNGYFNYYFEVASSTPTGNYTLRLDYNGTSWMPWDPINQAWNGYVFTLSYLNTSSIFSNELLITTPVTLSFNFWINGTTSDMYNQPVINRGDHLDLSVNATWGGTPVADGQVITFYDVTQNYLIGTSTTSSGLAQLLYTTATIAGPHQIYAKWGSYFNFSYFIVDEQIIVDVESGPVPREVNRGQTNFNLHGYVNDTLGFPIKYAEIFVHLYDGPTEVSSYLMYQSGSFHTDANGEFDLFYKVRGDTPDQNYTIQIEFNGALGGFLYSIPPSNNPHNFYLGFPNFYDVDIAPYQLKVNDPDNLNITLSVEGNYTLPFYDNGHPPKTYYFGQEAHFQVRIWHSQDVTGREVRLIDDYTNSLIQAYTFPSSNPFVQINVSTNDLHAGLNRIRVEYHTFATINMTYVVVNETFTISPSPTRTSTLRGINSFNVNTNVRDGSIDLNGLEITLLLLDSSYRDVSSYLNMAGPRTITVYNGYFQFNINSIALNCPEGQYYIGVAFYGDVFDAGISLFDYIIHVNSSFILINVIAGTNVIEGSYYTDYDSIYPEYSDQWIINDTLHVTGSLTWDNGTAMRNMFINVTIYNMILGGVLIAYNDTVQTDSFGNFHVTIFIDQNDPWPQYRRDSEIWVYFDPVINGLQYVQGSNNNYMT